jgi:antibiotic biosynthesis monooxygenase (ABM) superfamily enzyme
MLRRVYRLDRFTVPVSAREEFLEQVRRTHQVLRGLPGFIEDVVLERAAGPSQFNVITMVVWANQAAVDDARVAVSVAHRQAGFNRHELLSRLGVEADVASYSEVAS